MKIRFTILLIMCSLLLSAQEKQTGIFQFSEDIGKPVIKGSATYDANSQVYNLKGSGYNIWFGRDEFRYLYNKIKGDFILTASFEFIGEGKNAHRKTGWMIRATTEDNSPHASAVLHGDGLTLLQWRPLKGSFMRDPEDQVFGSAGRNSISPS